MDNINTDKISASTKETTKMVKETFGADEIYPANPNLVLSTDDTPLFVFEDTSGGSEDWELKIIDKTNSKSSVRGDFEVGEDAENSGDLRVRLTFTFTASRLAVPPYVSISGLTVEELSIEYCPNGILAVKVPGLSKGDDIFNEGFGWLAFLCAGKKDKSLNPWLSIGNKKFIHYNNNVLLPFIQSIQENIGWRKGQPIPEWLTSI